MGGPWEQEEKRAAPITADMLAITLRNFIISLVSS